MGHTPTSNFSDSPPSHWVLFKPQWKETMLRFELFYYVNQQATEEVPAFRWALVWKHQTTFPDIHAAICYGIEGFIP